MLDDLMPFDLPKNENAIIKVLGVGGGGSNAVNHMFKQGIKDVDFVVCNTDAQALVKSPVPIKVQLGESLTEGRGAGNKPDMGRESAIENLDNVTKLFTASTKMAFITAGMGGGTGTGAAPIIAEAAQEMGILTVAIVTIPFKFEGQRRIKQAVDGINELSKHVDSLLIIRNEKLREMTGDMKISEAFSKADNVLTTAAKGIAEIITETGHVNVDFADVQTVMKDSGVALMGNGIATGPDRALQAVESALNSPLLNNNDIKGAKNLLLNICSGTDEASMDELYMINDHVQQAAGNNADLIWGSYQDAGLGEKISVTVIATGFETDVIPELYTPKAVEKTILEETPKKEKKQTVQLQEEELIFEVSDKTKNEEVTFSANEIFGLDDSDNDEFGFLDEEDQEDEITLETRSTETENFTPNQPAQESRIRNNGYNPSSTSQNIDELENIPAYKRKNVQIKSSENFSKKNNISRYSLSDDDEDSLLNPNNPYLHDNVD